jgi:hypothetical protein
MRALFDYFTVQVMLPCVFSLALTIYSYVSGSRDTIWVVVYTLFMIIWATYYSEYWKRKRSHIAYSWGYDVTEVESITSDDPNPDFVGHARFNWIKRKEELKDLSANVSSTVRVIGYVIAFGLIALNIWVFLLLK